MIVGRGVGIVAIEKLGGKKLTNAGAREKRKGGREKIASKRVMCLKNASY